MILRLLVRTSPALLLLASVPVLNVRQFVVVAVVALVNAGVIAGMMLGFADNVPGLIASGDPRDPWRLVRVSAKMNGSFSSAVLVVLCIVVSLLD